MSKITKIPLRPTTKWAISTVQGDGLIVLQLDFISSPMEGKSSSDHSPHFVLSPEDAYALGQKLQEAARQTGEIERRQFPRKVQ